MLLPLCAAGQADLASSIVSFQPLPILLIPPPPLHYPSHLSHPVIAVTRPAGSKSVFMD